MTKFLYGAAVQGIQQFIFQSSELREIAGASSLVEQVCKQIFANCFFDDEKQDNYERFKREYADGIIINAAGNIKFRFDDRQICERVVRMFPKKVTEHVPGVTISQAVIELTNGELDDDTIVRLEEKLRQQRNHLMRNATMGMMCTLRSRKTGLPAVEWLEDSPVDHASLSKKDNPSSLQDLCQQAFGIEKIRPSQLPYNIEDIEGNHKWVAIIHADGNGLGQVVRKVGRKLDTFKEFSHRLEIATQAAVNDAFCQLVDENAISLVNDEGKSLIIPIRPVVLGGDDVTIICRADIAMSFTQKFCIAFQSRTKEHLSSILKDYAVFAGGEDYLTACAGIAFVKSNYPFHYGYNLAEQLCGVAKKGSRQQVKDTENCLIPASVSFHKVQDSIILGYEDIRERELKISNNIDFENGPYFVEASKNNWTVNDLLLNVKKLVKEDKIVKNAVRQWLSLMAEGHFEEAKQKRDRILQVKDATHRKLAQDLTAPRSASSSVYPAYDVMSLASIYGNN